MNIADFVGDRVEIRWSRGDLQYINAIGDTWSNLDGAPSPYKVGPAELQRFFRVKLE